jgi:hypothetical protein
MLVLHARCVTSGEPEQRELSTTAPLTWQFTERVCVPLLHETEQPDHCEYDHAPSWHDCVLLHTNNKIQKARPMSIAQKRPQQQVGR